jgi:hypothetical protein
MNYRQRLDRIGEQLARKAPREWPAAAYLDMWRALHRVYGQGEAPDPPDRTPAEWKRWHRDGIARAEAVYAAADAAE